MKEYAIIYEAQDSVLKESEYKLHGLYATVEEAEMELTRMQRPLLRYGVKATINQRIKTTTKGYPVTELPSELCIQHGNKGLMDKYIIKKLVD